MLLLIQNCQCNAYQIMTHTHTFDIYRIDQDNSGNNRWHFDGKNKDNTYTQGFFQIPDDQTTSGPSIILNIGESPATIGFTHIQKIDENTFHFITGNSELFVLNFSTAGLLSSWPIDLLTESVAATITQINKTTQRLRIRL